MPDSNLFAELRAAAFAASPKPPTLVRNVNTDADCHAQYVFETGRMRSYLVVQCPAKEMPDRQRWPRFRIIDIQAISLGGHECLAIGASQEASSSDALLVEDLLVIVGSKVPRGLSPASTAEHVLASVIQLQGILKAKASPLSEEQQVGLFGELYLIREYLLGAMGAEAAITAWTGPEAAPQDFQANRFAIEVKTTRGNLPHKTKISSARQLQNNGDGKLFFARVSVDGQPSAGRTLIAQIASVEAAISDHPLALIAFREKLMRVGYRSEHRSAYEGTGYLVRQADFYDVRDAFPRITESGLPEGVLAVGYEIDMAFCEPFAVTEADFRNHLAAKHAS